METITKTISPEEDGSTVRHILRAKLHFSSHAISRLTRAENGILVNGQHARTTFVLHTGDILQVETGDHRPPKVEVTPGDWPLPVVWEDGHLLVVNKPAGMTAHASNFLPDTPTVAGALAWSRGTGFVFHSVNRLDKGTSGLMAVARHAHAQQVLQNMLHTDAYVREYLALAVGRVEPESGTIDAPIGKADGATVRREVRADGKRAVTHYETVLRGEDYTLLRVRLETGRTHQIRVHLQHIGHPIAGDFLYGEEDARLPGRFALHSARLVLTHPVTGERMAFESDAPRVFYDMLAAGSAARPDSNV